jgi:hypothetical protein
MVWGTLWAKTKLHFLRAKSALGASIVRVGFQPPPPKVDICETATLTKMAATGRGQPKNWPRPVAANGRGSGGIFLGVWSEYSHSEMRF